ncbi:hypothetical protein EON65_30460 [archaeon]|nr:MAG: hypothetical protein EON65_30460 [archaeon]
MGLDLCMYVYVPFISITHHITSSPSHLISPPRLGAGMLITLLASTSYLLARHHYPPLVSLPLALMSLDVLVRAIGTDTQSSERIFEFYMHIWKVFYACYLLLPFLA